MLSRFSRTSYATAFSGHARVPVNRPFDGTTSLQRHPAHPALLATRHLRPTSHSGQVAILAHSTGWPFCLMIRTVNPAEQPTSDTPAPAIAVFEPDQVEIPARYATPTRERVTLSARAQNIQAALVDRMVREGWVDLRAVPDSSELLEIALEHAARTLATTRWDRVLEASQSARSGRPSKLSARRRRR